VPSILIADDNPVIRSVVKKFLNRPDINVFEAVDGLDAVEKASQNKPDLIILDLSMPRMNGLDAARLLRPSLPEVPIILFTVFAESIPSTSLSDSGIDAVVSKANITALVENVKSILKDSPTG
jgi:CheY-like chemotaxis protein